MDQNIIINKKPDNKDKGKLLPIKHKKKFFVGFISYVIIFVMFFPYLLYKYQYFNILEAYMPNLDLIANILTWKGGPYDIWKYLYPNEVVTFYGYTSQTLINYLSLLGVTFLVSKETKRTNSIHKGWSIALIMLLMTYLLPGRAVSWAMDNIYEIIKKNSNKHPSAILSLTTLLGALITILIILSESILLHSYKKNLGNIANYILKIPKLFLK